MVGEAIVDSCDLEIVLCIGALSTVGLSNELGGALTEFLESSRVSLFQDGSLFEEGCEVLLESAILSAYAVRLRRTFAEPMLCFSLLSSVETPI